MQPQLSPEAYCEKIQQLWEMERSAQSEADLACICVERNQLFEGLYSRVFPSLVCYIRAFSKSGVSGTEDAEFLANGVMMRVYLSLKEGRFQSAKPFGPWCHQIARRVFLDSLRKPPQSNQVLVDDFADKSAAAESVSTSSSDHVQDLLGRLPEQDRRIVELYYLEKMPLPEIAQRFGGTVDSVRCLLYRIRKKLRHAANP